MGKLLIVDDDSDNLKAYLYALNDNHDFKWNISIAKNENEAKKFISKESFDVIITDLVMLNELSGLEVLKFAKVKDELIMVIILTAFDKKLDRLKAFELGAFDCIIKATPVMKTGQELVIKARTAFKFRELSLNLIETHKKISSLESQKKIDFLKKYFDPRVFSAFEKDPSLLDVKSKIITISFWDIRGFSALCETLINKPQLIDGFLKEYFIAASEIIYKHNGVLDKFIGDGVMALFGSINGEDNRVSAYNAVKAALDMKKRFEQILENWLPNWKLNTRQNIDIGLGCGIHTGESLVGNLGTENRLYYTAIGPNVNFAKLIESHAKGQILISTCTKERINGQFETKYFIKISGEKKIPGDSDIFEVVKEKLNLKNSI